MSGPVVIKVGGSLLDWPPLPRTIREEVEGPPARRVFVIGGGGLADAIRVLDRVHSIGEERSHLLALRALDVSARVVEGLVPGLVVVEDLADLAGVWSSGRTPILAPRRFIEADPALPRSWSATTDSISARVAEVLDASELVLWKSTPLPPGCTAKDAAGLGIVDPVFPSASRALRLVTYRNVRGDRPGMPWLMGGI